MFRYLIRSFGSFSASSSSPRARCRSRKIYFLEARLGARLFLSLKAVDSPEEAESSRLKVNEFELRGHIVVSISVTYVRHLTAYKATKSAIIVHVHCSLLANRGSFILFNINRNCVDYFGEARSHSLKFSSPYCSSTSENSSLCMLTKSDAHSKLGCMINIPLWLALRKQLGQLGQESPLVIVGGADSRSFAFTANRRGECWLSSECVNDRAFYELRERL